MVILLFFFSQVGRRSELRMNLTSERLEVHALPNIETVLLLFITLKKSKSLRREVCYRNQYGCLLSCFSLV